MGKLDPSQMDRWWKTRIEKEELHYGLKQDKPDATKNTKEVTFLNTLGQPQVKQASSPPAAAQSHLTGSGATIGAQRPQTSARPLLEGSPDDDVRSVASVARSAAGSAAGSAADGRAPSVAGKAGSVASQPRTAKAAGGSQAGTESQSALVKRLDLLEEALASERVKRLQAEEEMRQLMALQRSRGKK